MRNIVSRKYRHQGGVAHVEMDAGEHLFLICTGCAVDEFAGGMAPALARLQEHVGDGAEQLPLPPALP